MTESTLRGRHRSDARPTTPLTPLSTALGDHAGAVSKRSAVVAVSTGLMLSAAIPAASADTLPQAGGQAATSIAPEATQAVAPAASIMSVPADAEWAAPVAQIEIEAPANPELDAKPKPKPKVTVTRNTAASGASQAASRSATRQQAPAADAPASASGSAVIEVASRYVGVPYVWGGTTPQTGFDCSGFTSYVFAQLGVSLPHSSASQRGYGTVVSADQRQPGDLVYYPGHVAIYAGDDTVIDAPKPGGTVQFHHLYHSSVTYIRLV